MRNVGLIVAALTALPVAIWRGIVADRQATAAHRQADIAQQQVDKAQQQVDAAQQQVDTAQTQANTAQQGLRNERYQKGAEMLGSDVLSTRLGGIYALQRLAREYPAEYYVQIMRLFCAFARHPTRDDGHVEEVKAKFDIPQIREDVQIVVHAIAKRDTEKVSLEREEGFQLDLGHTYLTFASLQDANLENAQLGHANLSYATLNNANMRNIFSFELNLRDAELEQANLSDAFLSWVNLSDANLTNVNLSRADLFKANLSGAKLSGANLSRVSGLTQAQLDQARADPNNPPILDGVLDSETGQPLVWTGGRGAPLKDDD